MTITEKVKAYFDAGARQLSRKYRSIGLPPMLPEGKTYLDLLREKDPLTWARFNEDARTILISNEGIHIDLTEEEFNVWLVLRGLQPIASSPAPYANWVEYWAHNDTHPVKEKPIT